MASKSKNAAPDQMDSMDSMTPGFGAPLPDEEEFDSPLPGDDEEFGVDLTKFDNTPSWFAAAGVYRAELTDVRKKVSQAGNPMFEWDWTIRSESRYSGRKLTNRTALTPAAMFRVVDTLETLGVGGAGQNVRFRKMDVVGKEAAIVVLDDGLDNKGRPACRIDKVGRLEDYYSAVEETETAEALAREQDGLAG